LKVGASVGIAMLDDERADFDTLLRAADAAMHAAKEAGRNTYQYYSQDALLRIQRKLEIEHGLLGAIEREEFSLAYQPLLHAAHDQPPAIEALLRWHRPGIGYCSPAEFIPIAEKWAKSSASATGCWPRPAARRPPGTAPGWCSTASR